MMESSSYRRLRPAAGGDQVKNHRPGRSAVTVRARFPIAPCHWRNNTKSWSKHPCSKIRGDLCWGDPAPKLWGLANRRWEGLGHRPIAGSFGDCAALVEELGEIEFWR